MSVGSISSSALSQWSTTLFSKLDTQNKGYLDKTDLENAFSTSTAGSTTSTASSDQLFQTLDTNGDGKVTPQELTAGVKSLADSLFANLRGAGHHHGHGGKVGGPPPAPPTDDSSDDAGLTQDQLSALAADPTTDPRRASLMSALADNFTAADTDGNGKISRGEARAFDKSNQIQGASGDQQTAAATGAGASGSAGSTDGSISAQFLEFVKLLQLTGALGTAQPATSTMSVTA